MASSTTKPTAMVRAISDRLSRLKCSASITAAVASSASGITALGISVARTSRRNRKITDHHQDDGDQQGDLHVLDRGADGLGAVRQDVDRRWRAGCWPAAPAGPSRMLVHRLDDVGAGLLEDDQQDALAALQRRVGVGLAGIDPGADLVVLHVGTRAADVLDADRRAVADSRRPDCSRRRRPVIWSLA